MTEQELEAIFWKEAFSKASVERDEALQARDALAAACDKAWAALWDAHYGKGIDLNYVRAVTTAIREALDQHVPGWRGK